MGDRRKPIPEAIERRITKIFVSNLPDRCSGNDLAGVLRQYGVTYDIYIAKKRDKGDFKLVINVARFVLEDGEIRDRISERTRSDSRTKMNENAGQHVRFAKKGPISFKDALTRERSKVTNDSKTLVIDDKAGMYEDLYSRSLVIRVGSFEVLKNIKTVMKDMGLSSGVLRYMGGLQFIVSFNATDQANG